MRRMVDAVLFVAAFVAVLILTADLRAKVRKNRKNRKKSAIPSLLGVVSPR